MGRAAISFSKLADTASEELPSTMAAIRLSGMEISDLTLELSDLRYQMKFIYSNFSNLLLLGGLMWTIILCRENMLIQEKHGLSQDISHKKLNNSIYLLSTDSVLHFT